MEPSNRRIFAVLIWGRRVESTDCFASGSRRLGAAPFVATLMGCVAGGGSPGVDISGRPGISFSSRGFVYDCATLFSGASIWIRSTSLLRAHRTEDFCVGSRYLSLVQIPHAAIYFSRLLAVGCSIASINGDSRHTAQPVSSACIPVVCNNCDGDSSCLARSVECYRRLTGRNWPLVASRQN